MNFHADSTVYLPEYIILGTRVTNGMEWRMETHQSPSHTYQTKNTKTARYG